MVKVTFQWKHKRRNNLHQNIMAAVVSEHFRQSNQSLRTKQGGKTSHPLWPLSKTQKATTAGRCGKLETPCMAGGNADCTRLWKTVRVNTQSPHQWAIPCVGVHLKNWGQGATCPAVVMVAVTVVAKTRRQPSVCRWMNRWAKHGLHTQWSILSHKKEGNSDTRTNTGEPSVQHAEWKEAVTDTHRVVLLRGGNWNE